MDIITDVSKNGFEIIKINNIYIHSKYDPIKEAKRIIETNYEADHIHVLFGYGNGYVAEELLDKLGDYKMLVVDPLISKQLISLTTVHDNDERIVYWGPEVKRTINSYLRELAGEYGRKVKVICLPNYNKIFESDYLYLLQSVRDFQIKQQIGINTGMLFAEMWQRNITYSLPYVIKDKSLIELKDKWELPIVVASGGPSLTKQLPLLKKIKENVIIIAAGSTINSLLKENIEPDFVVSIDGGEPNYNHFKDINVEKTRLIYMPLNHYKIRNVFKKEAYVFYGTEDRYLRRYISNKFNVQFPVLAGGETVAHFAYSIAHVINSGPVALIGQDLAFTNNETHAKGNSHYKNIKEENISTIQLDGYYSGKVESSYAFQTMKMTFEEMAKFLETEQPTYNCTEGGVKIEGFKQMAFSEFIEQYVDFENKKSLFADETDVNIENKQEQLIKIYEEEILTLEVLIKLAHKAEKMLELKKNTKTIPIKTLAKLEKIDAQISEKVKDVQMFSLINPINLEIATLYKEKPNESEKEKVERVSNQSKALYSKLQEAFKKSKANLQGVLDELQEENKNE